MNLKDHRPPSFYHVCFAVPDLQAAMAELTDLIGLSWGEPMHDHLGDWPYSLVFSARFPHIELISSIEGSPWWVHQPSFHHLGWWTHCLSITHTRWQHSKRSPFFDGRDHGRRFLYIDAPASGARIEAVDISQQPGFLHRWLPQGHVPDALDRPP
jgi:hypothetical protein